MSSRHSEMKPERNCFVESKPDVLIDLTVKIVSKLCLSVQTSSSSIRISEFPPLSLTAVDFSD